MLSHTPGKITLILLLSLISVAAVAWPAQAQSVEVEHRPIAQVNIEGLNQVSERLVRNAIRSAPGQPYRRSVVDEDVVRITHLGRFGTVATRVIANPDGTVNLTFVVTELPLLADVQVLGNKAITDQQLLARVLLRSGDPIDPFLIERGQQQIRDAYADKGFFVASVNVDEQLLEDTGILLYQIREGPKVRIRGFRFEGNQMFPAGQLESQVRSQTHFPIFRSGDLNREKLDADAANIRRFYQNRGYLDAQVGRRIDLSPNQQDAVVTFVIHEGDRFLVENIEVVDADRFPPDQIILHMALRSGDVFSEAMMNRSIDAIEALYGRLGYLETTVQIERLFHQDEPKVDLVVRVHEGTASTVGKVTVVGNELTRDRVILRAVRGAMPGRPYDRTMLDDTDRWLRQSGLFSESTVTVLGDPGDDHRDVLIEVKEQNTGSISFGAGVSSDAGLIGAIDLSQRNFDIADFPESVREFLTGRSFRGAGQSFALSLQPGTRFSRYSISFAEPYLFETPYSFDTSLVYFRRERESYDEERFGGGFGLGKRFGDVWSGNIRVRAEQIDIRNIEAIAPVDIFDVQGTSLITSLGFAVVRSTTDSGLFPTTGTRLEFGVERAGVFGGDYDFTRARARFDKFWTLDEDFLGRKTVLSWRVETGYIFEEGQAPTFERFYAGGHRTLRGFRLRGAGPRGIRNDTGTRGRDPVGGDFMLLTGIEYNTPILEDFLRGVVFTDMGTVQRTIGVDEWRVSIGAGIRLKIPFLGEAPFALDFAVPLLKEDGDRTQFISFDLAVPFR